MVVSNNLVVYHYEFSRAFLLWKIMETLLPSSNLWYTLTKATMHNVHPTVSESSRNMRMETLLPSFSLFIASPIHTLHNVHQTVLTLGISRGSKIELFFTHNLKLDFDACASSSSSSSS